MNIILHNSLAATRTQLISRPFSGTCVLQLKQWRVAKGLSVNKTAEGILTDGPDYTFIDGRPTPLLHKQKLRIQRQREYASRIVELCSELDFAKKRHQDILQQQEQEVQRVLSDRLKPKGEAMTRKKK